MNSIDELKPFERAARIFCRNLGVDPDERMLVPPSPVAPLTKRYQPRWTMAAQDLAYLSHQLVALREAAAENANGGAVRSQPSAPHDPKQCVHCIAGEDHPPPPQEKPSA